MGLVWFAAGSYVAFVAASGTAVYTAKYVEHAWGKGGSFQLLCVLAVVATVLLTIGFGLGAAIIKRFPRARSSFAMGFAAAVFFVGVMWLLSIGHATPAESWLGVLLLPFIGGAMPALGGRDG